MWIIYRHVYTYINTFVHDNIHTPFSSIFSYVSERHIFTKGELQKHYREVLFSSGCHAVTDSSAKAAVATGACNFLRNMRKNSGVCELGAASLEADYRTIWCPFICCKIFGSCCGISGNGWVATTNVSWTAPLPFRLTFGWTSESNAMSKTHRDKTALKRLHLEMLQHSWSPVVARAARLTFTQWHYAV